jgi:rhamnose transport system permease protein
VIGRYRQELSVAAALALGLTLLAVTAPGFFKTEQLRSMAAGAAPVLVAAIGMTLVIVARQIDISIGSQFCACGVVVGLLAKAGVPVPVAALAAVIAGAGMGAVNGWLVAVLRFPSIVVTLATLVIIREALRWFREGEFVRDMPPGFQWFGLSHETGPWVLVAAAIGVFLAFAWGTRYLSAGRAVYATGSDPEAARLAGLRPEAVTFGVFVLMGALTGLAAVLNSVRFADVDPNAGAGLELQAIAAVVVGGTAISGGRGTMLGTLIGVVLLGAIGPALVFFHLQPQWEKAIQGAIILAAVASDRLFGKERRHG